MATDKNMLAEFPWDAGYAVPDLDNVLTPALVIYPEKVASNIDATLRLLDGNADRWRAHVKTAKLNYTLRNMMDCGVQNFKCATTLELLQACKSGATDVLYAHPAMGANAARVKDIAEQYPKVRVSVLAESEQQVDQWQGSRVGIFLDINPGMNRTGMQASEREEIVSLVQYVATRGIEFRGLHYYDGQYGGLGESERMAATRAGYDELLAIVRDIKTGGLSVAEIVTAGTPTFPCSLASEGFRKSDFIHRVSPGTVVYCDATCLTQLRADYGYSPAALVITRVVSRPQNDIVTCDAGHKTVSADAGVPTCVVVGHPELTPLGPSEEHLPMRVSGGKAPRLGEILYLLPRHICPTVNNFDLALLVRNGKVEGMEQISARGREAPLAFSGLVLQR